MKYLFAGDATGLLWDFWFDLSVAESILTLSYIGLTFLYIYGLVLLKKVEWTLDKTSVVVCLFIITYLGKLFFSYPPEVKTLGSFALALVNSA